MNAIMRTSYISVILRKINSFLMQINKKIEQMNVKQLKINKTIFIKIIFKK